MAQRDNRHDAPQDAWRDQDNHRQMGQYADDQRQHGGQRYDSGRDARNWGARDDGDLSRHDPAQASYGRAGAPEVRGAPSGGYQRDHQADPGYNRPGYTQNQGYQGYGSQDARQGGGYGGYGGQERHDYRNQAVQRDSWRGHGNDYGYEEDRQRYSGPSDYGSGQNRFQGGAGGYASNTGPYAGSQTYGERGDQLGYGSQQGRQQHHDPDYHQWREQQLRSLDEDYASWRGERYKKFSDEFDTWRKNRQPGQQKNADAASQGGTSDSGSAVTAGTAGTAGSVKK